MALVGAGCSSSALPTPSSAGTPGSAGPQGAGAAGARTATGTVTVRSGGKVVCVMTLVDGKGSCKVSTKDYKPGSVSFTGAYSGGDGLKAATSKPVSVQILKAQKAG
ncbi:MAG TPA: Ig-like domain-containing protein [Streptosporangiaceae bacterium]